MRRSVNPALFLFALLAIAPRHAPPPAASFKLIAPGGAYFPQSRVHIEAAGIAQSYTLSVLGAGKIEDGLFIAPQVERPLWTTVLGAAGGAVASTSVRIVPPPAPAQNLIAVATYRSGIALHDARTFALLGYAAIGGPTSDVAFAGDGSLFAADTDGATLTRITRSPWNLKQIAGVPEGNELVADPRNGGVYVTDRDYNGQGALTRIAAGGEVTHTATGLTAEGIALDAQQGIVYVGNVNDNSIAVVDSSSMRILRKIPTVERPFGLALDERHARLFVVSNTSPSMNGRGGFVAAIDLGAARRSVAKRSLPMRFPLGDAFDAQRGRLFVTDEAADAVYVLDATTLRPARKPLDTCATPWRPHIAHDRLYVPCAGSDRVDVFELRTLRRVAGAPFPTGGYPLSVAVWR